ncbi:rolling circle replication-associated protein [Bifidobacterium breve]|uniref:rolling circle replication-associated protein n=1 Tax=Bifidobacterium breve TaxID=1685 RepID=UPI00080B9DD0|nr:hypothetical protein [Bifidobacterium breve]
MPTISIRAHGMSASRWQQSVNPVTGEIMKPTSTQAPERSNTNGWTANVARRNEQTLQQIDFAAIDGEAAFVTLTMLKQQMPDVSSEQFHKWLNAWLVYMRRRGMRHYYWILEFQASGNPHLHVIVWLSDWRTGGAKRGYVHHRWDVVEQYRALAYWVKRLNADGVAAKVDAQNFQMVELGQSPTVDGVTLESATPERLLMYLAKHAARGVAHYQRQISNMPDDWQCRSGRVWGHDGKLPLREQLDVECSYEVFWQYRRLVRRWVCANASKMTDDDKQRRSIVSARRMLRCSRPDVSPYRGVSAWLPASVASQLLDAAVSMGGEREEE